MGKFMSASEFAAKSAELIGQKVTSQQAHRWVKKGEVAGAQPFGGGRRQQHVAPLSSWVRAAQLDRAPGPKIVRPLPPDSVIQAAIAQRTSLREMARVHHCDHTTLYRHALRRGWIHKHSAV